MSEPDRSNPWTTLSSREVYGNHWIRVREDQVLRPDGEPGIYGVVEFPTPAVGVLPVADDGRIWLVGQYRYPLGIYSWEIPEGGGHPGETPEASVLRELQEETGLIPAALERIGVAHLSNSVTNEIAFIFRATKLQAGPSAPEGNEQLEVRLWDWDVVWQMLQKHEITDSMTIIALLNEAVRRFTKLT